MKRLLAPRLRTIARLGTGTWVLTLAILFAGIANGTAQAKTVAYVTHPSNGTITAVDIATNRVIATIPVGTLPIGLAVAPDGRSVYVANRESSSISVVRTATNTLRDTIIIPPAEPTGEPPFLPRQLTVTPDGSRLYVSLDYPDGCPWEATLGIVDTRTRSVGFTGVVVGEGQVEDLVFGYEGSLYASVAGGCSDYFYYGGFALSPPGSGTLWGSLSLFERRDPVETGDIVVTAGLATAYLAISSADAVVAIDLDALRRFERLTTSIPVGVQPRGLALTPDAAALYVVNRCGRDPACLEPGSVSVIATGSNVVVTEIPVGVGATDVAITPDGRYAYVTNEAPGTVSVISTRTNTLIRTLSVGSAPSRIAIADVPPCMDCNGDGAATIDELLTMVDIAVGQASIAACPAADPQHSGLVAVDQILHAVDDALNGCTAD